MTAYCSGGALVVGSSSALIDNLARSSVLEMSFPEHFIFTEQFGVSDPFFSSGRPGHPLRADPGRQLPRHQGPPRRHLQDRGQHDQGQDPRGDPQDVQHQERLHAVGGGAGPQGERVVRGEVNKDDKMDE